MNAEPDPSNPFAGWPQAQARLAAARVTGRPHEVVDALAELARGWRSQRAWGRAEAHLEEALRWAASGSAVDARVELHCIAAEVAAETAEQARTPEQRSAARRRALGHAGEAAALATQVACPAWEVVVLLRASDVLDRCGRHDEAAVLQSRAVRGMVRVAG